MSLENKGSIPVTAFVTREPDRSGNFICNGTADDVQIQAAINYVGSLGGGTVILGRGTFDITSTLVDNGHNNIWLKGQGKYATKLDVTTAGLNPITITSVSGWKLSDFELDGNDQGVNDSHGIQMDVVTNSLLVDLWVHHISYATAVAVGVFIRDCTRVNVVRCRVEECDTEGIGIVGWDDGGCFYCNVIDCYLENNANGAQVASRAAHIVFIGADVSNRVWYSTAINCTGIDSEEHGIQIYQHAYHCSVIGCHITDFTVEGIAMGRGAGSEQTCIHLVCADNTVRVEQTGENATCCISSWSDGTVISGNTCEGMTAADSGAINGIYVDEGDYNTITGNYVTIADTFAAIRIDDSTGTVCTSNVLRCLDTGDTTYAFRFQNSSDCTQVNNVIEGIQYVCFGVTWTNNTCRRNKVINPYNYSQAFHRGETDLTNSMDSELAPFVIGGDVDSVETGQFVWADASAKGWQIDAADEWAITFAGLPYDAAQLIRIVIWAVSLATETDGMMLTVLVNAAADNEPFTTNQITATKVSASTNFAANDLIYWVIFGDDDGTIKTTVGGDQMEIKVEYAALSGENIATNAVFRHVTLEYV